MIQETRYIGEENMLLPPPKEQPEGKARQEKEPRS